MAPPGLSSCAPLQYLSRICSRSHDTRSTSDPSAEFHAAAVDGWRDAPSGVGLSLVASVVAFARSYDASVFRRRASSAASANNQSRNVAIFGTLAVTLGQTIQYVFDIRSDTSIGRTSRPLMRSQAASAVRASAIPCPSTAASINMLALLSAGPCRSEPTATPAVSNHRVQFF